MAITLEIRFPLGRYHATPWDRSVNEGAVEWPPAPWRLLRALVATWYTRWPELPVTVLDDLLAALGEPPSYHTPDTRPGHTRHYLPDTERTTRAAGNTNLTLDPFLWLDRATPLLARWEATLTAERRGHLAKLAELLPYLGRADSICQARLRDDDPEPDDTWWRPGTGGNENIRLLAPVTPVRRPVLELSPLEIRKGRRTQPPDTRWVGYTRRASSSAVAPPRAPAPRLVQAIRFAVVSRAPIRATNGVLLADEVHRQAAKQLNGQRAETLLGPRGKALDHAHAHWLPIPTGPEPGATVESLVIWVRDGLTPEEVEALLKIRDVSGRRGSRRESKPDDPGEGYEFRGLPPARLLLQAVGDLAAVVPELIGSARCWHSHTPYLPVRHRKRESLDDYVSADIAKELEYRGLPAARVTRLAPDDGLSDRWAREYRRYRMTEHLGKSRSGLGLCLEFDKPVSGPLLLGQLSHFGYGMFTPGAPPEFR